MFFERLIGYFVTFIKYLLRLLFERTLWDWLIEGKVYEVLILVGMIFAIYLFLKHLVKSFFVYGARGAKVVHRPINKFYRKLRERFKKHRLCRVCRNPLEKCTCPDNRGLSYKDRLKKWRIREKEIKLAQIQKQIQKEKMNKPVELKKRGGR